MAYALLILNRNDISSEEVALNGSHFSSYQSVQAELPMNYDKMTVTPDLSRQEIMMRTPRGVTWYIVVRL